MYYHPIPFSIRTMFSVSSYKPTIYYLFRSQLFFFFLHSNTFVYNIYHICFRSLFSLFCFGFFLSVLFFFFFLSYIHTSNHVKYGQLSPPLSPVDRRSRRSHLSNPFSRSIHLILCDLSPLIVNFFF